MTNCILLVDKDLNYDNLAMGLKEALQNDKSAFDADRLQKYTGTLAFQVHIFLHRNDRSI